MAENDTSDLRVRKISPLIPPCLLIEELQMTPEAHETVLNGRQAVVNILNGSDPRLLVVVGPCSIHDEISCMEYAHKLKGLQEEVKEKYVAVYC